MGAILRSRGIWIMVLVPTSLYTLHPSSLAQITFEKTYGGTSSDAGLCVQQTTDGGYVIAGASKSFTGGSSDVYLIKTDSMGDTVWTRTYGNAVDQDSGFCVQQTQDGGYILCGQTGDGGSVSYVYLIRTDSVGDSIWSRTYSGPEDYEAGYSVIQTRDGGYLVAGRTRYYGSGHKVYLIKTNSVGDALWTRSHGPGADCAYSIQPTSDSGYIAAGITYSFPDWGVYLVRTDPLGDTLWTSSIGGREYHIGYEVRQMPDRGYIISGTANAWGRDLLIVRTDSLGDTLWTKVYGYEDGNTQVGYSLDLTLGGNCVITGYDDGDVLLMRTDAGGDTLWTRRYGGSDDDCGKSVKQTSDGGFIITGFTWSFGSLRSDVYLIKTDENGLTGVEDERPAGDIIRTKIGLLENIPNPFTNSTVITYSLPIETRVSLRVFDMAGRLVETLVNERQTNGIHHLTWNRNTNPCGLYFCRLEVGDFTTARKMVVVE